MEDDDRSPDLCCYEDGRVAMDAGDFETAVVCFRRSGEIHTHYKTLELLGECLGSLNRWQEAIVPLAAASALNHGVRAPSLLAEAFLQIGRYSDAVYAADLALSRDMKNRKALAIRAEAKSRSRET